MMLVWLAVRPLVFVYEFILVRFWLPMPCFLVLSHSVCVCVWFLVCVCVCVVFGVCVCVCVCV